MEKGTSEIAKLAERIAKDPKSKLFVPLAEEYKKAGDIGKAITVLQDGLKNNPGYVTARSFLGRLLMEKGDLPGAQKELEEVIKAIPDNLLAQRKLADLYVMTGRKEDALQRYKTALGLNPGDKEVASLIADLEAGKEISGKFPGPKLAPKPVKSVPAPAVPPSPSSAQGKIAPVSGRPSPASPAPSPQQADKTAPKTVAPRPAAAPQKPEAPIPESISVPSTAGQAAPASERETPQHAAEPAPEELEIVEEIVELEPLEHPAGEAVKGKQQPEAVVNETAQEQAGTVIEMTDESSFDLTEPETGNDVAAELPDAAISWEPPPQETAFREPVPVAEESSDDINTNTLAELYITQGFYEKAIEIYEGMLAENRGNTALQNKLEKIRAMAGVAEQNAAFVTPQAAFAGEEPKEDLFSGETPVQPVNVQQPVQEESSKGEERVLRDAPPKPEIERSARQEPKPKAPGAAQEKAAETASPTIPQGPSARRKETIDRLESWLKNIIKEKP